MIVKVCDECRKFIDADNPCTIVALRDDKKQTIAFRKVGESGPLGKVSGHLCNNACAALFFDKWLEGVLPPMPEIEVVTEAQQPSRPHVVDLREPTPQEQAEQNSVLLSVLGSE